MPPSVPVEPSLLREYIRLSLHPSHRSVGAYLHLRESRRARRIGPHRKAVRAGIVVAVNDRDLGSIPYAKEVTGTPSARGGVLAMLGVGVAGARAVRR